MDTQNLQETLRKLVEGLPDTLPDLLAIARSLEHQGDLNSSIRILRQALARFPNATIHVELGNIYMKHKRFKDALMHLVDVLRENPQHHPTILLVCECLIECGEYDRAKAMLERANQAGAPRPRLMNLKRLMQDKQVSASQQLPWHNSSSHSQLSMSPLDPSTSGSVMTSLLPEDTVQEMSSMRPALGTPSTSVVPPALYRSMQEEADQTRALPSSFFTTNNHTEEEEDATTVTPFDREAFTRALEQHPSAPPLPKLGSDASATGEFDFHNETRALPTDVPTSAVAPDSIPFPTPPEGVTPHYEDDDPTTAFESPYRRAGLEAISQPSWTPSQEEHLDEQSRDEIRAQYFGIQEDAPAPIPNRIIPEQNKFVPPPIQEPVLELEDIEDDRPAARPQHRQVPATEIVQTDGQRAPRGKTNKQPAVKKKGNKIALMLIILPLLLVLAAFGAGLYADQSIAKEIDNHVNLAKKAQQLDTFTGYKQALEHYSKASQITSMLGGSVDDIIQNRLPAMPGFRAQQGKHRATANAAMIASMLEYRFTTPGKYEADKWTKKAQSNVGERHPMVLYSRIYQSLLNNPQLSITLSDGASQQHPRALYIREAHVQALMLTGQYEKAYTLAKEHFKDGNPSSTQRLLLAQAAHHTNRHKFAKTIYQSLLDSGREKHTGALIGKSLITSLDSTKALSEAQDIDNLLKSQEKDLSALQIIRTLDAISLMYMRAGEKAKAHDRAERAQKTSELRPDAFLSLIRRYQDAGQLKKAAPLIKLGLKANFNKPAFEILNAQHQRLLGKYPTAIKNLKSKIDYPDYHLELGLTYLATHDYLKARAAFDQGKALDARQGGFDALGILAKQLHSPSKSKMLTKKMDKLITDNASFEVVYAGAWSELLLAQQTSSGKVKQDAIAATKKRLIHAKRLRPYSSAITQLGCMLYLEVHNLTLAQRDCEHAYKSNPSHPMNIVGMARVHLAKGKLKETMALLEPARQTHPQDIDISTTLARTLLMSGRVNDAQKELDRWANKPFSKTAQYATLQGVTNFHAKAYTAAKNYLEQAITLDDSAVEPKIFNAYTKLRFGQLKEAERPLTKHLKVPKWGGYAWLALGELRRRQKRFSDAETNLSKALKILQKQSAPSWMIAEAYLQRALAWQDKHDWSHSKVKTYLDKAKDHTSGTTVELSYVLGLHTLNQKSANYAVALKHFQDVLELQPNHCLTLKSMVYTNKKLKKEKANKPILKTIKKHCT